MTHSPFKEKFQDKFSSLLENLPLENDALIKNQENENFSDKSETANHSKFSRSFVSVVKQLSLFFPAVFGLHFSIMAFVVILMEEPFFKGTPIIPRLTTWVFWAMNFVLIWLALGDLRKLKHSLIPLSVVALSLAVSFSAGLLQRFFPFVSEIIWNGLFPLCTFALALVAPFITKMWLEAKQLKNELS